MRVHKNAVSRSLRALMFAGPKLVEKTASFHLIDIAQIHKLLGLYFFDPRIHLSLSRFSLEQHPSFYQLPDICIRHPQ